jgi:hypothetical protein
MSDELFVGPTTVARPLDPAGTGVAAAQVPDR